MASSLFGGLEALRGAEVFWEMRERAHHRVRREAAQRAERAEFHGVAEVFEHGEVLVALDALDDAVDRLDAARRADAAGRALAAGFHRAELHGEARLLRHVDAVVEYDHAAVADEPIARGEGFVIERRVEQRAREVGAERPADLDRAHRAAA